LASATGSASCFLLGALSTPRPASWLVLCAGVLGFLFVELGHALSTDYYDYRRLERDCIPSINWTAQFDPPQLVLKGAWGAYLIAFFFALVAALALADRGWPLLLIAAAAFGLGYIGAVRPGRTAWRPLASTWLPFFSGTYLADAIPPIAAYFTVLALQAVVILIQLTCRPGQRGSGGALSSVNIF